MARRVPLNDPERAIQVIEQDGGVILTGFSSIANVQEVNRDAAPFIAAFKADVSYPLTLPKDPLQSCSPWFDIDLHSIASLKISPAGHSPLHAPLWP